MEGFKYLEVEWKKKTLFIWLKNPPANALNSVLMHELGLVLNRVLDDKNIYLLIITGEGKFFSAGADIKELKKLTKRNIKARKNFILDNNAILEKIENFPKPIIALINGYALGGGCELALACHLRFASAGAQLGLPEINLGIFPGWGGTWRLPKLIGKSNALEMILTGKMISADEALRIGLVDKVIDSAELLQTTKDFSKSLIDKSQDALKCALKSVMKELDQKAVADVFVDLLDKESAKEGINAFLRERASKKKS